jgi:hypothetical protein
VNEGSGRCQVFFVSAMVSCARWVDQDERWGYHYVSSVFKSAVILCGTIWYVGTYMVVHGLEDFLWRNQQRCHLPNGHLKVHLRELE